MIFVKGYEDFDMNENKNSGLSNYMFFENLKTIKAHIDTMLSMDEKEVDAIITNGHDWIQDHVTSSKDDIEEVCNFLCNKNKK